MTVILMPSTSDEDEGRWCGDGYAEPISDGSGARAWPEAPPEGRALSHAWLAQRRAHIGAAFMRAAAPQRPMDDSTGGVCTRARTITQSCEQTHTTQGLWHN